MDLCQLGADKFSTSNTATGSITTVLPVRTNRSCNALSFSSTKSNLLAVGLDKIRGDSSLIIWDVNQASGSGSWTTGSLNAGRSSAQVKSDRLAVQRYATGENINSVAFLPNSADLLIAAVGNLWLRQYDLRVNSDQHILSTPPMKVQGIAIDPLDPQRISSFAENMVMVWDSRRLSGPLLTFSLRDAMADGTQYYSTDHFVHVEFSSVQRGNLATLTREANHVRFWDVQQTPTFETSQVDKERVLKEAQRDALRSSKLSRLSWAASSTILPWNASPETSTPPVQLLSGSSNMVLANTRRSKLLELTRARFR